MADYVWHHRHQFRDATVLEVGAGTSLPSLVLAKSIDPIRLILSDIPSILPVVKGCLEKNQLNHIWVQALEWGSMGTDKSIDRLVEQIEITWDTKLDYILGSDTFYEPSQFEHLLVLVSYVIQRHNPNCIFLTTYQERSPKRSIQRLLDKWNLQCRMVPKHFFDFDENKYIMDHPLSEVKVNAGTLSSVFLLAISGKSCTHSVIFD
ncbi:Methyltransferase-like protein 23 [Choanephora cucurbitarum]|uniref:Methyltransferase-like protein 23 n=1 Tax=Choanephora cucurbitarum TaxID=101091 RepID=A0A1C7N094_9FUNG|nr:Methyltransferase-like protein 23 [Choanephora cucurbitarum]